VASERRPALHTTRETAKKEVARAKNESLIDRTIPVDRKAL
jgi:hypothetical protein